MLAGKTYGKAADVFSFGVVLWELITLKQPWRCVEGGWGAQRWRFCALSHAIPPPHPNPKPNPQTPNPKTTHHRDETEGRAALYFIMSEVIGGNRLSMPPPDAIHPPLPEIDDVIALAEACWHQQPQCRPSMAAVAGRLREIINGIKVGGGLLGEVDGGWKGCVGYGMFEWVVCFCTACEAL